MINLNTLITSLATGKTRLVNDNDGYAEQQDVIQYLTDYKNLLEKQTGEHIIADLAPDVTDRFIQTYGEQYQIDRFIEEASELIKALLKRRRTDLPEDRFNQDKINADIQEEIADTLITISQVIKIYGDEEQIREVMNLKIERARAELEKKNIRT